MGTDERGVGKMAISEMGGLRDCLHKNQFLPGRFAQTDFFYRDDSPGTIRTNGENVD